MGIKCEYCGKFIAHKDFEKGLASYVNASPNIMQPPEPKPICKRCTGEYHGN